MPVWEEHAYTRKDEHGSIITLEEYEALHPGKAFTWADFKLYLICGVGFMLDSYDLFIVNLASPIWAYEFFTKGDLATTKTVPAPTIPFLVRGAVNAAANIGNVAGQISFGFLGDLFGRKFVYGKELIIAIFGIIMIISLPVNGSKGLTTGVQRCGGSLVGASCSELALEVTIQCLLPLSPSVPLSAIVAACLAGFLATKVG
jgi:PHS family inorganic phosphate transporter-like MFS transporter